jgi:dTDP-4-amino-4,6-dideoxygalactose transaminase
MERKVIQMKVPIVDLVRQHESLKDDITRAVADAIAAGAFVGGREVEAFERDFASYLGATEVVGVSTGTSALHLTLRALGVGPGDAVVVPEETGLASRETMEAAITPSTRALVPVHLYGHVVDMTPILELGRRRDLWVIEDAAQAHGARYTRAAGSPRAGSIGHAAAFSFYPAKNLGAIGEGGACASADPTLAARVRMLRDHGQSTKHVHEHIGDNGRLHAIQAAALRIKLPRLDRWNRRRREIAAYYVAELGAADVRLVREPSWSESVHHQFVIRVANRDAWIDALAARGVGSAVHYPTPIHLQPAFTRLGRGQGSLPAAETLAREVLSLPVIPELTDAGQAAGLTGTHGR